MGTYARRSPLRFLAPVALVIFAVALLMIVSGSSGGDGDDTPSASDQEKARDLGTSGKKSKKRRTGDDALPTRTYTVKRGDTLGSISEKTGIPVDKLQELNPQIDPQQLTTGQKVKLRE
jgi:LysM repeat protein